MNEDTPMLSVQKMFARDSSFWQYKIYADILYGSHGRGHHLTVVWSRAINF